MPSAEAHVYCTVLYYAAVAGVAEGTGCLLGPCPVKCSGYMYQQPVCGSDGKTYPDK